MQLDFRDDSQELQRDFRVGIFAALKKSRQWAARYTRTAKEVVQHRTKPRRYLFAWPELPSAARICSDGDETKGSTNIKRLKA